MPDALFSRRCVGEGALAITISVSNAIPNSIWCDSHSVRGGIQVPACGSLLSIVPIQFGANHSCVARDCGVAPWLRWRFSLRTLLIATTLVAVVLGLIVWSVR